MKKPSTYKEQVTNILRRSGLSRNNNLTLYKHLLKEFYNTDIKEITAHELFTGIATNIYPNYDVIGRTSRKLQETIEELRGTEWAKRHQLEEPIITDLRTNF